MKKIQRGKKFCVLLGAIPFVLALMCSCAPRTEVVDEPVGLLSDFDLRYEGGWHPLETSGDDSWRWAKSPAVIRLFANADAKEALFKSEIRGAAEQNVVVLFNGARIRELHLTESDFQDLVLGLSLRDGENILEFVSDQKGRFFEGDSRELGFLLRNDSCVVRSAEDAFKIAYADGWYGQESVGVDKWRWSSGIASLQTTNILATPVKARLICHVRTIVARKIGVSINGENVGTVDLPDNGDIDTELEFVLKPGVSRIEFSSAQAATKVEGDTRELSFCLYEPSIVAVDL